MSALLVLWATTAAANARSWIAAGEHVRATLSAMTEAQGRLPSGATVLVDALDSVKGAYVFRNGLSEAAALSGLRPDVTWRRGTSAAVGPSAVSRLGRDLFVIEPTPRGGVDRTICEKLLWQDAPVVLQVWEVGDRQASSLPGYVLPPLPHPVGRRLAALVIPIAGNAGALGGTIYWRNPERGPFTISASRQFVVDPRFGATPVRLGRTGVAAALQLRLDTEAIGTARLRAVALIDVPAACLAIGGASDWRSRAPTAARDWS